MVGASCWTDRAAFAEPACSFGGVTQPELETEIVDERGHAFARLTGSAIALTVEALPEMPSVRARIVTSIPEVPGFRVAGYASVRALGIRTKSRIDILPPLLALPPGVRIDAAVRVGNDLFIEKRLSGDFEQTLAARTTCDAIGFGDAPAPALEALPEKARAYRFGTDALALFDSAVAETPRAMLARHTGAVPVLFYALAEERERVLLRYDGDVLVRAWAYKRDLEPLARGELFDRLAPVRSVRSVPKLALAGSPSVHRANQALPLRTQAAKSAAIIGEVRPDAEFYVVEVISGWASVLPRSLAVMPLPERQFWVEAKLLDL
jgi:hypothetical protein